MDIDQDELRERYRSLSTDELVYIKVGSDLTEEASMLLDEELSKRDANPDDFDHANKVEGPRKADIESLNRRTKRDIRNFVILVVLIALIGIYAEFFAEWQIREGITPGSVAFVTAFLMLLFFLAWRWAGKALPPASVIDLEVLDSEPEPDTEHSEEIASAPEFISTDDPFTDFVMNFYRQPSPQEAVAFLEESATTLARTENLAGNPSIYFFLRVAQQNPRVVKDYESLCDSLDDPAARELVEAIIRLCHGESSVLPGIIDDRLSVRLKPLEGNINTFIDLDYLWMEFFVTGNELAVERIAEATQWPDRVRLKLVSWLQRRTTWYTGWIRRWQVYRLARRTGIQVNLKKRAIWTKGDLDTALTLKGGIWYTREQMNEHTGGLPFVLTPEDWDYIELKSTARWSVTMNRYHVRHVDRICARLVGAEEEISDSVAGYGDTGENSEVQRVHLGRIGSSSYFQGEPLLSTVSARALLLQLAVICLVTPLVFLNWKELETAIVILVVQSPVAAITVFLFLLIVSMLVGAFRKFAILLLSRSAVMPMVDDTGRVFFSYIGDVPSLKWQYSPWYRAGTWVFVAATSLAGAIVGGMYLETQILELNFLWSFMILLALRYVVSGIPSWIAVKSMGDGELQFTKFEDDK